MEPFVLVEALINGCGCLLEIFAVSSGAGAGVTGYKARKRADQRKEARAAGEEAPRNPYFRWFLVLLFVTILSIGLLVFKWVQ